MNPMVEGQLSEVLNRLGSLSTQVAVLDSKVDRINGTVADTASKLYSHEHKPHHNGTELYIERIASIEKDVKTNTRWRYALPIGLVIQTGSILGVFIWLLRSGL